MKGSMGISKGYFAAAAATLLSLWMLIQRLVSEVLWAKEED
jgi:hypothetical protein